MNTPRTTIVYIDGFNLYYRLKSTPYKWLDLRRLCSVCLEPSKHEIIKIKYFTALIKESSQDSSNTTRQQLFLRALRTIPNLDIILGQFKKRQVKGILCNEKKKRMKNKIVTVEKWEEKETDVNIATHLVEDAYKHQKIYKCAVLFSNDTDLKTPLLRVKKTEKLVGVISPYKTIHTDLIRVAHFKNIMSDSVLKMCQFPREMKDAKGAFSCPEEWL